MGAVYRVSPEYVACTMTGTWYVMNSPHKGGHCYVLQNGLIKSIILQFNPLHFLEIMQVDHKYYYTHSLYLFSASCCEIKHATEITTFVG